VDLGVGEVVQEPHPGWFSVYKQLMKLNVIILLQITAICAILVHDLVVDLNRTWLDTALTIAVTVVGGTLSAGGSNAINMWYDSDIDPLMRRTKNRPVPQGHISARGALIFGTTIAIIGSSLFFIVSWKAAFWSFFSVLFYVFIYSIWLKRRTPQNIVIGGIAGSTPPLIGWAAAAGDSILDSVNPMALGSPIPWLFFALIFFWTPPHFWALALYRSGEYAKAEVPMMNEVRGPEHTVFLSKVYSVFLFLLGSVPCFWPNSGLPLLWAFIAGGLTLWYAKSVWDIDPLEELDENGRMPKAAKSFFRSLYYLGWMHLALVLVCVPPSSWLGPLGPL
jgi:protoheme IX farnesyltransferase